MYKKYHKHISILGLAILAVLLPVLLLSLPQKTDIEQSASGLPNLNASSDMPPANNPDGTMGPQTSQENQWPKSASTAGTLIVNFINSSLTKNNSLGLISLPITISKGEVHLSMAGQGNQRNLPKQSLQDGGLWETLAMPQAVQVDVMKIGAQKSFQLLGSTKLPSGQYTEVRLYISSANATFDNGTLAALVLGNQGGIIRVVRPFIVNSGKTTILTFDVDAQKSVIKEGSSYALHPFIGQFLASQ